MQNQKSDELIQIYSDLPLSYQKCLFELAQTMQKQAKKGKEKYGMTIDENPSLDPDYWLNHATEELADFLVYWEKYNQTKNSKN